MAKFGTWTHYKDELPPLHTKVLLCCLYEDDGFHGPYISEIETGYYEGQKTQGDAIVMETPDDWYPCTHWMPLPDVPEFF